MCQYRHPVCDDFVSGDTLIFQIRLVCKNVRVCNSAIQVLQQIPVLCPLDYSRDSDLTQGSYLQHPEMMMFKVLGRGGGLGVTKHYLSNKSLTLSACRVYTEENIQRRKRADKRAAKRRKYVEKNENMLFI